MEKEFFDDFQIDKNDYKEDFAKCDKLTADLQVEKFDLDKYRDKNLVFSSELSDSQNILNKFALKEMGKELAKEKEYEKLILYLESLLENSYFENDYYVYRQLAIYYLRTRPKRFDKQLEIIKKFFKSGIYCSHNQYLWFSKKLFELRDRGLTTDEEILSYTKYFRENGRLNKLNENFPVILAERIYKKHNGYVDIDSEYSYERAQMRQELEFIGQQFKNDGDYESVIDFYNGVFEYTDFDSIRMYDNLISSYEQLGDYESMLDTLSILFKKNYIRGETNKIKFSKKLDFVNKELGTSFTINDLKEYNFKQLNRNDQAFNASDSKNKYIGKKDINPETNVKDSNVSTHELLFKYAELYEKGLLTREEFEFMKKQIFSQQINNSDNESQEVNDLNNNKDLKSSNNNRPVYKKFSRDYIVKTIITVGRKNFYNLQKFNIGDKILAIRTKKSNPINMRIVDIEGFVTVKSPTDNIIKISGNNYNYIKSLKPGDLIAVKTKNRPGSVILEIYE